MTGKPLLLQRIDAALEEGKKRGAFKSAREWSKKAGLSDNYVGVLRTRLQTGEVKQAKGEELTKLAGVLGYPVSYFLGSEDFAPIPRREVERDDILSLIEGFEWPEDVTTDDANEALRLLRQEHQKSTEPLPPPFWRMRYRRLILEVQGRAKSAPQRAPVEDVDLTQESPEVRAVRKKPKRL